MPKFKNKKSVDKENIETIINGIMDYIYSTMNLNRQDSLCPSDYRVFTTNPLSIAYGALGIAYFLQKEGKLKEEVKKWILQHKIDNVNYSPSLYTGLAGISWALSEIGFEEASRKVMEILYTHPLLFNGFDIFYGVGGWGMASLYFWLKTKDDKYLNKSLEAGDFLMNSAQMDKRGCSWPNVDGTTYIGFAHGASGIALFLLYLYLLSNESRFLELAIKAIDFDLSYMEKKEDYITFPRTINDKFLTSYWQYGSAGIGTVLIRFYRYLKDPRYLKLAELCAKDAHRKYVYQPSQFRGLSGMGEFLLDMYYFTKNNEFLRQAEEVAEGVLLFSIKRPEGIAFLGDELMRISNDYGTGSAGIGMFLHRLLTLEPKVFVMDELLKGRGNW